MKLSEDPRIKLEDKRNELLKAALSCLASPYKYGAKRWDGNPKNFPKEFDCSSFTHAVYKQIGIDIPMRSLEQASAGRPVKGELETGDLLFFKSDTGYYNPEHPDGIGHVIMYIGYNRVIGACGNFPYKRKRVDHVALFSLDKVMKRDDYRGARRIFGYE